MKEYKRKKCNQILKIIKSCKLINWKEKKNIQKIGKKNIGQKL